MLLPVCTFSLHTTPTSVSCTWGVCVGYYVTSATSLCLHRRCGPASTPGSGFQPPGPRDGAFLPFKPPSDTRHSGRSKPTWWGTNCRIMFGVWDLSPINHGVFISRPRCYGYFKILFMFIGTLKSQLLLNPLLNINTLIKKRLLLDLN